MKIRELVEINQQGLVADAVNFSIMAKPEDNLRLCQGFVFNYNPEQPKQSTLGVLDAIRESFHGPNNPNVHLMVQDFGKGKSHFALTLANFFKHPGDSPEVQGILEQIKFAISDSNQAPYEKLKAYKNRSRPHLVLCISGEAAADLGKMLLQALRNTLREHGIDNAIAQHLIEKPLNYLKGLTGEKRQRAEQYLTSIGNPYGDLADMTELLAEDNYDILPIVRDLSAELEYTAYDFEYNLNIETILADVVNKLCDGDNQRFEGILILFDELNAYLKTWLKNNNAAGGNALQNLTNACSNHKGKVILLCLAQVRPSIDLALTHLERKNYERFTTRIELAPSTYDPESSLELVIDNLLKQSDNVQWRTFREHWDDTLRGESRIAYDRYIVAKNSQKWPFDKFHKHLGLGCYPLHPLTAYLLCNLDFTQGRTAIQFIKEDVKQFIDNQPVAIDEKLQLIRPVRLIDAFASNFSQKNTYSDYEKAYTAIVASATPEEITVLKAIALYYLSSGKISKPDNEGHEEILSVLTGFSIPKTKEILGRLSQEYRVIYYNTSKKIYNFYSGFSINELQRKIAEEIEDQTPEFKDLYQYCQKNLTRYLGGDAIRAKEFTDKNRLHGEDWQFEYQLFTIEQFERILSSERSIRGLTHRGIIAYFIGEYSQDMATIREAAESALAKAPKAVQERIVLAIPRKGTEDLARVLLMRNVLENKDNAEKQEFGVALVELAKQYDDQLDSELKSILLDCTYTCRVIHKVPHADRNKLESIISKMMEELYIYVVPVENQPSLRTKSTTGSSIVGQASRLLLTNKLQEPFPNQSHKTTIEAAFVYRWQLLKPGTPYKVQVPKNPNVRQAWDTISEMTDIGDSTQKSLEVKKLWDALSAAPYGYNELTFTLLFAAWLAYHRAEVKLWGTFGIPKNRKESIPSKDAPIQDWANTNILEKPKDFIAHWVINMGGKLIRQKPMEFNVPDSVDYDSAIQWIDRINTYLEANLLDPQRASTLQEKRRQLQAGVDAIDPWLEKVAEAQASLENQHANLEDLATACVTLEQKPPTPTPTEGVIIVCETEQQTNTWSDVQKQLKDRLETLVKALTTQAQTLESESRGYELKANIDLKVQALAKIPGLPNRFIHDLQLAAEIAEQKIGEIKATQSIRGALKQIQDLYATLGENASQNQYSTAQARIQKIAEQTPSVQKENEYLEILSQIEDCQDQLVRQLDLWETRLADLSSPADALKLTEEVNREVKRFDQEDSQQLVQSLIKRIRSRVLEQEGVEAEESTLEDILQKARQKVRSVQSLKNLSDAAQAYDELSQISFPQTIKLVNLDGYERQLVELKSAGKQAIDQKFEQLLQACDRELKRNEDYIKLKGFVTRANQLIAGNPEFSSLRERMQEAEDTLEVKYSELVRRGEDVRALQQLKQFQPAMGNTIKRCEEIIRDIEVIQSRLNFVDQHGDYISQLIATFQKQRSEYITHLDEIAAQLQTLETQQQLQNTQTELSKLEFVFKDSSEYERHQNLGHQLQQVSEDFGKIINLEAQKQSANSITEIEKLRSEINTLRSQLHHPTRFQARLDILDATLSQRHQQFHNELLQWQQTIATLTQPAQAKKLRTQITSQSNRYLGSDLEQTYNTTLNDVEALTDLLKLIDAQKSDTVEVCQIEIDRLEEWQSSQETLSDLVTGRLKRAKANILKTQQDIQKRHHDAAQKWLANLQGRIDQLTSTQDPKDRLEQAKNILKEIRKNRSRHEESLEPTQRNILAEIRKQCEDVQNQDRASQIETLFRELPKNERLAIYKRLSTYLEETTEVF